MFKVLFMKGNPEAPRCGFSNTMCSRLFPPLLFFFWQHLKHCLHCPGILKQAGLTKYSTFDILQDDKIRQGKIAGGSSFSHYWGLKKHSKWPTYPQLYHKGELLGGLGWWILKVVKKLSTDLLFIDIIKEMIEDGELQEMI